MLWLVSWVWKCWLKLEMCRLAEDGANFSINSDDPMVTGTWMEHVRIHINLYLFLYVFVSITNIFFYIRSEIHIKAFFRNMILFSDPCKLNFKHKYRHKNYLQVLYKEIREFYFSRGVFWDQFGLENILSIARGVFHSKLVEETWGKSKIFYTLD